VAYFTDGQPTKGLAVFTATHDGATYWFASAAHRDAFAKEPGKYVPAFGGYCAMGVVFNKKIDVDPTLWRIVDGKLYVNVSPGAAKRWNEDVPGNIGKGNANWTQIKAKPPSAL
jgi:YHS domain-containing protein